MGLFSFSFSSSKRRRHGGYGGSYYRSGGYSSFSSSDRWRHGGYGAPHHNSGLGGMIGAAGLGTIVGAALGSQGKKTPQPVPQPVSQNNQHGASPAPVQQTTASVCPSCNSTVPAGSKFCLECGTKLQSSSPFCSACGSEVPAGSKFCPNCGTPR